jgi:CheY-like chemotaxis protein
MAFIPVFVIKKMLRPYASTGLLLIFPDDSLFPRALKSIMYDHMKLRNPEPGKTILIIDDDQDFHMLVGSMLRNSGYRVRSLFEGTTNAVSRLAKKSDMVLLDIELPGDSGVDIGKRLKADPSTANIPVILISGHTELDALFVASQANACLQKPFSLHGLLKKITTLMTTPGGDGHPEPGVNYY